jgi:hypothetical protein
MTHHMSSVVSIMETKLLDTRKVYLGVLGDLQAKLRSMDLATFQSIVPDLRTGLPDDTEAAMLIDEITAEKLNWATREKELMEEERILIARIAALKRATQPIHIL